MAKRSPSSSPSRLVFSLFFPRGGDSIYYLIAILSIFSLLIHHLSLSASAADSHQFEGFDADDEIDELEDSLHSISDLPIRSHPPPTTLSTPSDPESHHGPPPPDPTATSSDPSEPAADLKPSPPTSSSFDFWDEDEFEGLPTPTTPSEPSKITETDTATDDPSSIPSNPNSTTDSGTPDAPRSLKSFTIEIICVSFLITFAVNYFTGRKENENIALAWVTKFAARDTIFEKNFSLLGIGEGEDAPLLLKEGQNVFKFYASGRRFCQGMLATIELQSRHDLISRLYNMVVPSKDEVTFEVFMNDESMDQIVFALAKKKAAKVMQKEVRDLQRFGNLMNAPSGRKWVVDDLAAITESKEVAGDLITDAVLDQVFGEKSFEKFGKWFISMHFSDQNPNTHKKTLVFKFALPDVKHMADMTRLVALIPYYIDLIGRYKLSSQARSKTESVRAKIAQEMYKELQNARQEALQRKKLDRKKMIEEAEAKLNAETLRKKEAKERARQMKKSMPKVKMTRAH